MTDRKLLVAAAAAVGLVWDPKLRPELAGLWAGEFYSGQEWNPLTDDGDALRLAVKLGLILNLSPRADCRGQTVVKYDGLSGVEEPCYNGREEAARRAIVRAAVAMSGVQA